MGTLFVTIGQALNDWGDRLWVASGVLTLLASGATQVAREMASANVAKIDKAQAVEYYVAIKDALKPIARLVADMPALDSSKRDNQLQLIAAQATGALVLLLHDVNGVRATVYRVNRAGTLMECISFHGRGSGRRKPSPFQKGEDERGNAAFRLIEEGEPRFVPDIRDRNHPDMADFYGTGKGYRTFITAGINTEDEAFGMVSVDAPKANSLAERNTHAVSLVADLVSTAFAIVEHAPSPARGPQPPPVGDGA